MNVPIAEILSLSVLRIRSFSNPRVTLMNPNAAPNAAGHGSQSTTEAVAIAMVTETLAKCSLPYAPLVARKLKYRSNHAKADRCIAVIVTVKLERCR